MAHRGTEYNFEPGEYVLCFEPDCTKARVLYDAKVLELAGSQDRRGHWKPEYTVHFQGWNSSWDRIVPETFIQKNSAENRALMKRLAVVARNVRSNHSRKRKIDILLKQHFGRKMPADSSDSSSDSDNTEEDGDEDDDDDLTDVDNYEDNGKGNQSTTEDETENAANEESDDDKEYSDGLELHGPHDIELDLPIELRTKLEDDCYFVTKKRRLVTLPADPNVLTVLEGYVKNFALNILYGTVEKPRTRDHQSHLPERNIDLCKEVMDGLRVIFDFCLPSVLLYDNERAQYEGLAARYKPMLPMKKEVEEAPPAPEVTSPRLRSSTRQTMSPDAAGGGEDTSQHLPHLSPRSSTKRERDDMSDDDMPARRMTRHAYQAEIRYRKPTEPRPKSSGQTEGCLGSTEKRRGGNTPRPECSDVGANTETRRRESLRSSTRHSSELLHGTAAALGLAQKNVSLTDRVTPPPPLLIPSVISSKASKGSSSPHHTPTYKSRCSTPTLTDKEGMMNGVLAWKLIPDDAYQQIPPAPSQICGAIHLLRLFVKIPEIINKMTIPESSVKPLVKHLWLLQEYMADNCEDLFPDSVYTDAQDSLRGSASKR